MMPSRVSPRTGPAMLAAESGATSHGITVYHDVAVSGPNGNRSRVTILPKYLEEGNSPSFRRPFARKTPEPARNLTRGPAFRHAPRP